MSYSGNVGRMIVLAPLLIYIGHSYTSYRVRQANETARTELLERLDTDGFIILRGHASFSALAPARLEEHLESLWAAEGEAAGSEFKQEAGTRRLANLMAKDDANRSLATLISDPIVLEMCGHVFGGQERVKLSSLNARSSPGGGTAGTGRQPLHADSGAIADERGYWVCNALWMVTNYTLLNGALRVVPGSHARRELPHVALSDPLAPHPDEVLVTGAAGDVIIFNAHMWHGGTANRGVLGSPRTSIHALYTRRDKPQQSYQRQLLQEAGVAIEAGTCAAKDANAAACSGHGGGGGGDDGNKAEVELRWLLALDDEENDALSAAAEAGASGFL